MKKIFRQKNKARVTHSTVEINGKYLPTTIFYERRNGYRCSFTKKGLNIRIPLNVPKQKQKNILAHCTNWAKEIIQQKPKLLSQYQQKVYKSGNTIELFDKSYVLEIEKHAKNSIKTKILDDKLYITIPQFETEEIIESKIISKAFANHYRTLLKKKVLYWNQYFPIKHNSLRLKNNSSNWGSCSSKRNINLSTRLLLCPENIIDYVIVHELAHLIQQNHSKAFWLEVERVFPSYKEEVKWLKTKGAHLDF